MRNETTIQYKTSKGIILIDVDYYYLEGCEGDLQTPPRLAEVVINAAYADDKIKQDILELLDADLVKTWEEDILKEYE